MFRKSLIILAMLAVLPSCLDETVKPIKEAPASTWPSMTNEDDIVKAVLWCYANTSSGDVMSRYESILHSEYFFYLASEDIKLGGEAVITRAEDILLTEALFGNHIMLELSITTSGGWYEREEVAGLPCEGCRESTRQYFIRAQLSRDGTIYVSSPTTACVTIIVAPDESDSSKWVIRAIYDIAI